METLSKDRSLSPLAKRAVQILQDNLDKRFTINEDMIVASFLDPSLQHLRIVQEYLIDHELDMAQLLHEKWVKYELSTDDIATSAPKRKVPQERSNDVKRIRLELLEKHCGAASSSVGISVIDCIQREVNKYTSVEGVVEDPLKWWSENGIQFPYLCKIAKVILSFQATSAMVERFFSKAGILLTKRKANLNPINLQKILFVHENYNLIKDFYSTI